MKTQLIAMSLAGLMSLTGCATHQGQNEHAGIIIGGLLGGLLGSEVGGGDGRVAAIIVGTLAGAQIGGSVGRSMDDTDRMKTNQTLETVRTGVGSSWVNPDSGNRYAVTPTRTYESASGPCRDYTIDADIDGSIETVVGTACRQSDGSWRSQY